MVTALLLIDIQNDYFPGGNMEVEGSVQASLRAREVLDLFRKMAMPVIHVRHISVRPGATFFLPGTGGVEIHENVRPLSTETLIEKNYPNSFRDTPLRQILEKEGVARLVIAGMMTHMCVDATTRAAFDYGFGCTVVHDACATRQLSFGGATVPAVQVQSAFLAALNGLYAKVASAGDFISRESANEERKS
ncbi:MAG: cysteine hydrolase family protein [Syntrophobacteraceae bacterium]